MQRSWQTPHNLLILMSIAMPIAFSAWAALLNNFVVERAGFTGVEIGILQSLREVPGFLAFTTVFVLLVLREQTFAVLALALLGIGVALRQGRRTACLWQVDFRRFDYLPGRLRRAVGNAGTAPTRLCLDIPARRRILQRPGRIHVDRVSAISRRT
jgi:hypothetical protein